MKKNKLERVFVNPFTEAFMPTWELWKEYKQEEWKFQYKSVLSEQAAINLLVRLSSGDEKMAAAIIRQSMENRWQGLFPYKNLTSNVKSNGQKTGNNSQTTRESVNNAYDKRFGGGGQNSPVNGT
jgi:hypothetical protein